MIACLSDDEPSRIRLNHFGEGIVTAEALINETPAGQQKAFWASLNKIAETADHSFIYVSAMSAAIIPHTVFVNAEQQAAFLQLVQQYYRNATGRGLPITSS